MNECASNPCQHGGVCTDHLNGYMCSCSTGYTGEQCETNIDDCVNHPCLHGGTCIDGINSYSCHCSLPYDGDRCQYELVKNQFRYISFFIFFSIKKIFI